MQMKTILAGAALLAAAGLAPQASAQLITGADSITQSSTNGSFTADLAINGNFGDFTHTVGGGADTNPTLRWDLPGGDYFLDDLIIYNRTSCCQSRLRDITVIVRDAADTTDLFTSPLLNPENSLNGPASLSVDLSGVTGGIVLVHRTPDPDLSGTGGVGNSDEGWVLSIGELEAFGTPVPEPTALGLLGLGGLAILRRRRA